MIELPSIANIVKQYDLQPKKSLGQNFIFDANLLKKIALQAGDLTQSTILEIGPGPGGLTRAILELGAKAVVAIEQDTRCIAALRELAEHYPGRLTIIEADALTISEEDYITSPCKIIANLPYNIATPLLIKWLEKIHLFESLTLMFQKEVAMRIVAPPGSKVFGRLSVMTQFLCHSVHNFDIAPTAFIPPPKVTSSVITLTRREQKLAELDFAALEQVVKLTFGQRRKAISTSLKQLTKEPMVLLSGTSIKPNNRPEELTVEQFCELTARWLKEQTSGPLHENMSTSSL